MVKAKLGSLTEKWISGKTDIHNNGKTEKKKPAVDKKILQSFYLTEKAVKLLRYNRAETGEFISTTLERLVIEHLGKSK